MSIDRSGTGLLGKISDFIQLYLSFFISRLYTEVVKLNQETIFKLDFGDIIV
jgi:hypothetical protein